MKYRNQYDYDQGEIVFYEITRRHTSIDSRDAGLQWEYILGTVDDINEAEDICFDLQKLANVVVDKAKGYVNVWENITINGAPATRSTSTWIDKDGYLEAIAKFREIDPTFYGSGNPEYLYRGIRKMKNFKIKQ